MLRGETSAQDRVFVEEFCKKHNIPVFSTAIPIPKILEEEGETHKQFAEGKGMAFLQK